VSIDATCTGYSLMVIQGHGGGIVKMPEDCGANSQALGSGFTLYIFVDNLEKVRPSDQ
jgi:hypothetical protein